MRAAKRALGALGALLMGLLAVAGLALSAAFVAVSTDAGRGLLIPRLVRAADDALAGRIELGAFRLRTQGGVELDGIRVLDPDGDTVLTVERALVDVDLSRLRLRTIGLR